MINIGRVYNELHPDLASKWSLTTADQAVTAHERGVFSASARLIDAMGRDDRIEATLGTRIQALLGLDFCMEPAKPEPKPGQRDPKPANDDSAAAPAEPYDDAPPTPEAKAAAEELERTFFEYADEEAQREALRWRIMAGFAIAELIWTDDAGRVQDRPQRVKIWHLQFCRWDTITQQFMLQTADAGEVAVEHGNGKWIIFGNGQRPWMKAAVRSLWLLWLLRQYGWRDMGVLGERTAKGIVKAKVPSTPEGERSRLVQSLLATWKGIVAELPQGIDKDSIGHDLEMLETGMDEQALTSLLERTDIGIAVRLLGQNLTTEVGSKGSYAATTAHDRVRTDYLKADAQGFSTDWRIGALKPIAERKYGNAELAPYPKWDADPPEDEKASADAQKSAGDAVAAWQAAGYDVENVEDVAERHGLKITKRKVDPNAQPGAAGGPAATGPSAPGVGGPKPAAQTPPKEGTPAPAKQPVKPPARPLAATMLEQRQTDPGFVQGQEYIDGLVASATQRASEALAIDIANILRVVQAAESPEALRAGLAALYADSSADELAHVLERARMMAELAGKYSVIEDVAGGVT